MAAFLYISPRDSNIPIFRSSITVRRKQNVPYIMSEVRWFQTIELEPNPCVKNGDRFPNRSFYLKTLSVRATLPRVISGIFCVDDDKAWDRVGSILAWS
jgi:hypothetical protein